MAVRIKENKEDSKTTEVGFSKSDFIVVKGLENSFFEGELKAVHKIVGNKLIAKKLAEKSKADLEEVKNPLRIVSDEPV